MEELFDLLWTAIWITLALYVVVAVLVGAVGLMAAVSWPVWALVLAVL